jgi:geranylgeranyl pyrophosphate synthase
VTATLDPAAAPAAIAAWLDRVRPAIDDAIAERLPAPADDPGRLCEAMRYAALGPGKRLRPALVVAACEATGGTIDDALPAAAAIEMLHAYTLVHDDLPAMDDDDERRGRPTVHRAFGEAIAILAGDGLLTLAFGVLAELGGARTGDAVGVLARRAGTLELLVGQARDLTEPPPTTIADAERVHAAKTGALFAASCELGAICAGAAPAERDALGRYGLAIGIAFQHADDRDDGELIDLAVEARARIGALCGEAGAIAAGLGPRAETLAAVARWIAARGARS